VTLVREVLKVMPKAHVILLFAKYANKRMISWQGLGTSSRHSLRDHCMACDLQSFNVISGASETAKL
jgi:hypothetical protein